MTIVACDFKSMCADSLCIDNGARSIAQKIFVTKRGVIGIAGDLVAGRKFVSWYCDRRRPRPSQDTDGDFEALVYHKGELMWWNQQFAPVPVQDPYWAIGSGRDAALGALSVGAPIERAVEAACKVIVSCGLPVVKVDLQGT